LTFALELTFAPTQPEPAQKDHRTKLPRLKLERATNDDGQTPFSIIVFFLQSSKHPGRSAVRLATASSK
jgi:hypothetical protein